MATFANAQLSALQAVALYSCFGSHYPKESDAESISLQQICIDVCLEVLDSSASMFSSDEASTSTPNLFLWPNWLELIK